jgi:hypothetical protein
MRVRRSVRHYLDPVNPTIAEQLSDADPPTTGVVTMADGKPYLVPPPGSIAEYFAQRAKPTKARSEGTAATRDAQAYDSFGAAPEGPKELTK